MLFRALKYGIWTFFIKVLSGNPQLEQIPGKTKISFVSSPLIIGSAVIVGTGGTGPSSATAKPRSMFCWRVRLYVLRFHLGSAILPQNSMNELPVGSSNLMVKVGIVCFLVALRAPSSFSSSFSSPKIWLSESIRDWIFV